MIAKIILLLNDQVFNFVFDLNVSKQSLSLISCGSAFHWYGAVTKMNMVHLTMQHILMFLEVSGGL